MHEAKNGIDAPQDRAVCPCFVMKARVYRVPSTGVGNDKIFQAIPSRVTFGT